MSPVDEIEAQKDQGSSNEQEVVQLVTKEYGAELDATYRHQIDIHRNSGIASR